jgi:hypothetical protein
MLPLYERTGATTVRPTSLVYSSRMADEPIELLLPPLMVPPLTSAFLRLSCATPLDLLLPELRGSGIQFGNSLFIV